VLEGWAKAIEAREKFSPLAACWTSELGGLNKFVHTWVYEDLNERARIREESRRPGGGMAGTDRGAAGPAGKQADDPGNLLTGAVVGCGAAIMT
jgi:NIPSNAP